MSNALKEQIEFELVTKIKKSREKIKELNDSLSFEYSLSGTFKGLGSNLAQNAVNNRIDKYKEQLEVEENAIAWYENIAKRYNVSIGSK